MGKLEFRKLKADEIDVRIGSTKLENPQDKYSRVIAASYLLYKDARVDMRLLDEVVGAMNWQRKHEFKDGKLYCTVSIWDEEKKMWIAKEDVGVESNTEAEKGQASDSFKRACFNFGIGRELYTAPFIWIEAKDVKENLKNVKMVVRHIAYDDSGKITELIIEDNKGNLRYEDYGGRKKKEPEKSTKKTVEKPVEEPKITGGNVKFQIPDRMTLLQMARNCDIDMGKLATYHKKYNPNDLTDEEIYNAILLKQNRGKKNANI